MSANQKSRGTSATLSKEAPTRHGKDGHEATQDDGSTATHKNPPNHGVPTHGIGRFLWETPTDTPVSELGAQYRAWCEDRDGWKTGSIEATLGDYAGGDDE